MVYKAADYEKVMKSLNMVISGVTSAVKLPENSLNEAVAEASKDKFGGKKEMASIILNFAQISIDVRSMMKSVHGHNFDLRGKLAELSTGSLKKLGDDVLSTTSSLREKVEVVQETIKKSEIPLLKKDILSVKEAVNKSYASVVGVGDCKSVIEPAMREVLKGPDIIQPFIKNVYKERDDMLDRKTKLMIFNVDAETEDEVTVDEKKEIIKERAVEVLKKVWDYDMDKTGYYIPTSLASEYVFMGKVTPDMKVSPPILVETWKADRAKSCISNSKLLYKDDPNCPVRIRADLNPHERNERSELNKTLKQKIQDFPEMHWVIRNGTVTSIGKHHGREG